MGIGIGLGMQFGGGSPLTAFDTIKSLYSPDRIYRASIGWEGDGAIQIGSVPGPTAAYVANHLYSTSTVFQSSTSGWWRTCCFKIEYDDGSSNQCIGAKNESTKQEHALRWDRTTKLLTLFVFTADGLSVASIPSTVVCNVGDKCFVTCGFKSTGSGIFISVKNATTGLSESRQSLAIGFTIGASTAKWTIGKDIAGSLNFYGKQDSVGWCKDYDVTDADITELHAGVVYRNLSAGLKAKFDVANKGAFYDFATPTPASDYATMLDWPWLRSSAATSLPLTQATGGATYPYVCAGLVAINQTGSTTKGVAFLRDQSGNGYDIEQPHDGNRGGYDPTGGPDGGPAFYSSGNVWDLANSNGVGTTWPSFRGVSGYNTTNGSWWRAGMFKCKSKTRPSDSYATTDWVYGQTPLGGICTYGFPGYMPYSTASTTNPAMHTSGRFGLHPEPYVFADGNLARMYTERIIPSYQRFGGSTYRDEYPEGVWVPIVIWHDGTTKTTTCRINKRQQFSAVVQFDQNGDGTHDLGTFSTIACDEFGDCQHYDNFAFPAGAVNQAYTGFSSASNSHYGWSDLMMSKAGTALDATSADALADLMIVAANRVTNERPEWISPTPATPIWWFSSSACSTRGKSRTAAFNAANAAWPDVARLEGDVIGLIYDRIGGLVNRYASAPADGNRPTLHLNGQNSNPVIRFTKASQQYLQALTGTIAQPYSITFAFKFHTAPGTSGEMLWTSSNDSCGFGIVSSNRLQLYAGTGLQFNVAGSDLTNFGVWTLVLNGASSKVFRSGTQMVSGDAGSTTQTAGLNIGTYRGAIANCCDIDVSELIIHSQALTLAEHTTLSDNITLCLSH